MTTNDPFHRPLDRAHLLAHALAMLKAGERVDFSRITLVSSEYVAQDFVFLPLDGARGIEADLRGHSWAHTSKE